MTNQKGWKWARKFNKTEKKLSRALKTMNTKKDSGMKYKFGVVVPRTGDIRGAMNRDKENGNKLWYEAQEKEATSLRSMGNFEVIQEDFNLSEYQ